MAMVISTNMSALNTTNQLNKNSSLMNSALEKLSSGYSINSAADNAAGLAISEKMRAQIQGLDQASSNSQDAISLAQTADGGLDETNEILKRMRELAVQASSDTLTDDDRDSIQDEVDTLRQEIDRISNDTEYNTIKLLNGNSGASVAVSKTSVAAIVTSASASNNTASGSYDVAYTSVATQATTGSSAYASASILGTSAASASATVISDYAGNIEINGTTVTIESGDTIEGLIKKINDETDTTGVTASLTTGAGGNYYIQLTDSTYGSKSAISLEADSDTLSKVFAAIDSASTATSVTEYGKNATGTINGAAALGDGNTLSAFGLTVTGDDSKLTTAASGASYKSAVAAVDTALDNLVTAMAASTASTSVADIAAATSYTDALSNGNATAINNALQALLEQAKTSSDTSINGLATTYKSAVSNLEKLDDVASATVTVDSSSSLTFQVGANSGQTMSLSISDMDANALGVAGSTSDSGIDLSSAEVATKAITTIDSAISKVAAERSNLGAVQNSLESNINMLDTESENLTSAESNIRDTDMASVMAEYTKLSVVTQAATAMLAKANSQPQQVLTLLQG
jgi:flagellin